VAGGAGGGGGGAGRGRGAIAVPTHARFHGVRGNGLRGRGERFPLLFSFTSHTRFSLPFVISLVCFTTSWDRPGWRAKGRLQRAATAQTAGRIGLYISSP